MVVYNKKVSKRRRKRTGSKRKITKPRNKRMNRSRQMGGAAFPDLTQAQQDAVTAAQQGADAAPRVVDLPSVATQYPALSAVPRAENEAAVTTRAQVLDGMLFNGVRNQQALCNNIKGSIGNLINRVKQCETTGDPIDLSELAKALNKILVNVVLLNGQCEGLGDLLKLLEQRLMDAGCLRADTYGEFIARVDKIAPTDTGEILGAPPPPAPAGGAGAGSSLADIARDGPPAPVAGAGGVGL